MTTETITEVHTTSEDGSRYYTHPVTGEQLTSVTTILSATVGKPFLTAWAAKLAAEFAVANLDLVAEVMKAQGRRAAEDLVKNQAKQSRERKADAGSYVHAVGEALTLWAASPEGTGADIALPVLPDHLVGADYDGELLDQVVDTMVTGFLNFVTDFNPTFEATEMAVYNRVLGVAGTLDMIIVLRDVALTPDGWMVRAPGKFLVLCVDIKTGRNLDVTVREQLAAYRRMHEARLPQGQVVAMPATDAGAILHLRPEHEGGYRLMPISAADDAKAWNRFRRAIEIEHGRSEVRSKPGHVAYPLNPDGTMPAPRLADLDGEGYGRVLSPLIKAGLADVDEVAMMTAAELLAVNGIGNKTLETVRQMLADHALTFADEAVMAGQVA